MKKIILLLIFNIFLFAKVNVISSIAPIEFLVKQIGDGKVNSSIMVPAGASPHTYEPKPSQMVAISKADIYFAIGVEFEHSWLNKFKAQNRNLKIIDCSKEIKKIPITEGEEKGELDPHIWLSPKNLKKISTCIESGLEEVDSKNSTFYKDNLNKLLNKIDKLDKNVTSLTKPLKNRAFLVFHPSWGYFAKDYNLTQIAIEISGKEPSPKELIKVIKRAKKDNIKAIFTQPEFSDKSAKIIANELGVVVKKVSPLKENVLENILEFAKALSGK